jgi:hypothetical protein
MDTPATLSPAGGPRLSRLLDGMAFLCRRATDGLPRALLAAALAPALAGQVVFAPPEQVLPPLTNDVLGGNVLAGDFDEDGHQDLLTIQGLLATETALLLGAGDGTLAPGGSAPLNLQDLLATADVGGDGHLDVLAVRAGSLSLFDGRGDGTFETPLVLSANQTHVRGAIGDLDADGRPDLAVSRALFFNGAEVDIRLQDEDGGFDISQAIPVTSTPLSGILALSLEDVDHDGSLDLLTGVTSGAVRVFEGLGDGTFAPVGTHTVVPGVGPVDPGLTLHIQDVDLDGEVDLIGIRPQVATPYVRWGQPGGTFGDVLTLPPLTGKPKGMTAADWDGDGQLDLAVSTVAEDGVDAGVLHVLRQLAPRSFEHVLEVTGGGPMVQPATPDLDGDGLPDLAAFLGTFEQTTGTVVTVLNATYGADEPFTDLGGATPGSAGWPVLIGEGTLAPWSSYRVTLAGAPAGALPTLVMGDAPQEQALLGGLLWPQPQRLVAMPPVDASGRSVHESPWPAGLSGVALWAQVWFADEGAPQGWASTTGLLLSGP